MRARTIHSRANCCFFVFHHHHMPSALWLAQTQARSAARCLAATSSTRASYRQSSPRRVSSSSRKLTDRIDYNANAFFSNSDNSADKSNYAVVTANELESCHEPPKRVKMLVRDFIEDSLYNHQYGYFPKQATIFSSADTMVDFNRIRDGNQFQELVAEKYAGYGMDKAGPGRQIFHTPTELFRVRLCIPFLSGDHDSHTPSAVLWSSDSAMSSFRISP